MPIFIANTYDGKIKSVILARNYELAQAYWQGKGFIAHTITERNESDLEGHPTGILPILETTKITASPFGRNPKDYLVVSKE